MNGVQLRSAADRRDDNMYRAGEAVEFRPSCFGEWTDGVVMLEEGSFAR